MCQLHNYLHNSIAQNPPKVCRLIFFALQMSAVMKYYTIALKKQNPPSWESRKDQTWTGQAVWKQLMHELVSNSEMYWDRYRVELRLISNYELQARVKILNIYKSKYCYSHARHHDSHNLLVTCSLCNFQIIQWPYGFVYGSWSR